MSRGPGKIERRILDAVKFEKENSSFLYNRGGLSITMLMYMVYYGNDYWSKIDCNSDNYDEEFTDKYGYPGFELTDSQKQRVWSAVRSLERRGYVATEKRYAGGDALFSHGGRKYYKTVKLSL